MGKGSQEVEIRLEPTARREGKVLVPGYKRIYWSTPDGTLTEEAVIEPEGAFTYAKPHGPGEFLTLAGMPPLFTRPMPLHADGPPLQIEGPGGPLRAVTVRVGDANPQRNATVGLWLGGIRVPPQALALHQRLRGAPWLIVGGKPVALADLAAGNVEVGLGPDPQALAALPNPVAVELALTTGRRAPGADGVVVFE